MGKKRGVGKGEGKSSVKCFIQPIGLHYFRLNEFIAVNFKKSPLTYRPNPLEFFFLVHYMNAMNMTEFKKSFQLKKKFEFEVLTL